MKALILIAATSVAAILALVGGCSSTSTSTAPISGLTSMAQRLKVEIREHVADPERQDAALQVAVRLDMEAQRVAEQVRITQENLRQLNPDYDADRADFDQVMVRARVARRELLEAGIESMLELRGLIERAEWAQIQEGMMEAARS